MTVRHLDPSSLDDYRIFLRVKSLPCYRFAGRLPVVPPEYEALLRGDSPPPPEVPYDPTPGLWDYQRDVAALAIRRRKYAVFADCGLGKTFIISEFVRHALRVLPPGRCALVVSPLMVIDQTVSEVSRRYGDSLPLEVVRARDLDSWLATGTGRLGITNWEAMRESVRPGRLGCLADDESSMLKSHYGKWGGENIRLGRGLDWKLACTGTPAPNDRIEYANHAVFLDAFPTVNSFLARFFVNRGQTDNRWELKPHALRPFYRALSHWCIFLSDPSVYGWRDNARPLPPIRVHVHDVDLTREQADAVRDATGQLFPASAGGIVTRTALARIAKGKGGIPTNKVSFIRSLVDSWPDESTIIWCLYNDEQDAVAAAFPDAANIDGSTPHEERMRLVAEFKSGARRELISKPKILGFGLNLQVATRHVFSGLQDSYEQFYQAVKRSNRYGATRPLNVHIPVTDVERPMVESVLYKARRIEQDTREQEEMFRDASRRP